jgi:hypothetical protein
MALVWNTETDKGINEEPPDWDIVQALLKNGNSFEAFGLAQMGGAPVTLSGSAETGRVMQMPVDANGLAITGVAPLLGRTYEPADFADVVKQKEARSIVITYEAWQRRLGGAADVIGTSFHVDGEPRTVIGVMPRGFKLIPWEDDIAFWAANDLSRIPKARWMAAMGRLKPGVSVAAAQAEATTISRQVVEARGEKPGTLAAKVVPIHEAFFGRPQVVLTFLLGAVSFVLLIACVNVVNLLLARTATREREMAVRRAVGAARGRLIRQLLTESALLALLGGVLGGVLVGYEYHQLPAAKCELCNDCGCQ